MKTPILSIPAVAVLVCALALGGCASGGSAVPSFDQAVGAPALQEQIWFPDASSTWLKGGTFVDVEQLRRIGRDMTKNQVRELIGYPHFGEGLFGPTEWDYLFNFRTGKGDEFVTCQYKVVFKDGLSGGMYGKEPACADFLKPRAAEPVRAVPTVTTAPERFRLGADALFAFDGSGSADILPEGRRQLDALAAQLKDRYKRLDSVTVIGHTDRLGSDGYNHALSVARANTVRAYLVSQGLPPAAVRAYGVGKTQPVAQCARSLSNTALIACLQPDRRVELEVTGER
ncbi:MAG: OmpA family protein [Variovorax sp.]